jgi:hypothetical protein
MLGFMACMRIPVAISFIDKHDYQSREALSKHKQELEHLR